MYNSKWIWISSVSVLRNGKAEKGLKRSAGFPDSYVQLGPFENSETKEISVEAVFPRDPGPGSLARRARFALLGVVVGAGICYPIGLLQMKVFERANSKSNSDVNEAREIAQSQSRVDVPIDTLENILQKK
ncbi:hypothetical protein FCM35_KLT11853 [Carex littledalei]|uniref:Uncharacterized protein n=1 Tax=Carex littledalei TaxID=544730 RepID=A0A833V3U0_9POAL|nr:hypothetical protein FCM35_KLT11853 [Carex littledalei]